MQFRVQVLGIHQIEKALRSFPVTASAEVRREMVGMDGLGVEWKQEIAKTFSGTSPGGTRRGEKWLYSKKGGSLEQQLFHFVHGFTLNSLTLTMFATDAAAIHDLGGRVTAGGSDKMIVPIGEARRRRGTSRPLRISDLYNPFRITTKRGFTFIAEPNDEEPSEPRFMFLLVDAVENPGGRLRFHAVNMKMRDRAIARFNRALNRACVRTNEMTPSRIAA